MSGHNRRGLISKKKLESGKDQWAVKKEVLGCMADGATRCIELERDKKIAIDAKMHTILRMKKGVTFKQIEKMIEKSDMQQQHSQWVKIDDTN